MSRSGSSSENYSKSSRSNNKHSSGNEDRFGGYVEAEVSGSQDICIINFVWCRLHYYFNCGVVELPLAAI